MATTDTKKTKVNFHYPSYNFRAEEQDPIIDTVRTVLEDHDISFIKASVGSGVSTTTLYNWFTKQKTRRPQYATIAAVLGFAGYELVAAPKSRGSNNGHATPASVMKRFPSAKEVRKIV